MNKSISLEYKIIKEDISKYISLSDDEFDYYFGLLKAKKFARSENLLQSGDVCKEAYFIQSGCIRYYNLVDGEEQTGQFFFEGSWYSDYDSFLFEKPTTQTIQALEETTVAVLSKAALQKLYKEVPKFERFGRLMAENAFMGLRKYTESLTHISAEERYKLLIKSRPKVMQRVPQQYIASYLGIRPQSLSRIRKNLE
ncbi:cAMP-binding domain of CRP or a regulatory subunit of cAMP-dependent protein kinases [Marivirga sericea]|uniref:cAMP-binding domain of CRP or a regulatory subunit of cAMP-dependent protein kinases n=1 Tax=Marivirga sericea TaxID=1028 RepID=A0A1X7I169_9BACT|nr:Crp/Fnr family transcriptional regulator [Marivirga sericea]SMG07871.1 cAMP-binding domain of CRP or a regulatory subunit of cAMP-dependent protein kinases [Marivirga sericea]